MRRKKFFVVSLALLLGGLLFSTPASAITIDDVNDDFTINWSLAQGGSDNDGGVTAPFALSATAAVNITSISSTQLALTITLTNTTAGANQAAILSFGMGVSPDATGSFAQTGAVFDGIEAGNGPQQTYPGGFKNIDICVFAANGCSGGAINDGLQSGNKVDTFSIILAGAFGTPSSVTLTPFPIKFQTSGGSFEFAGTTTPGGGTPVPEPGTIILLGSGLVGLGLNQWRKRAK